MNNEEYLTAGQVRARFGGVSLMWIHRKQRDHGFPAPASRFGGRRRFWRTADLIDWEARMIGAKAEPYPRPCQL